jgi:uncharacterized membrane protein
MSQFTPPRLTLCLNLSLVGFALSILIPSTAVLQKYFGLVGVAIYIAIASLALLIIYRHVFTRFASKVTDKQVLYLTVVTFLILLVVFLVVYPLANSGMVGRGSDRDEALNIATTELLKGLSILCQDIPRESHHSITRFTGACSSFCSTWKWCVSKLLLAIYFSF